MESFALSVVEIKQDVIEQLHVQFGMLSQEVSFTLPILRHYLPDK
jgi:hypothetical protein